MFSLYDFLNIYTLLGCVLVLLWYRNRSAYSFWRNLNVKYLEPVPFLGNTYKGLLTFSPFHVEFHNLYTALQDEPFGGIYELQRPQLLVKDPQLVSSILIKDFKHFYDQGFKQYFTGDRKLDPLSIHLFSTDGERWRVLRQKMSPVFTSGKLKHMHNQILDCVASLTEYINTQMDLNDSIDVGLKELFEKLTIDVIGSCAFGIDCNSFKSNETFSKMGREVFKMRLTVAVRMILATFNPRLAKMLKMRALKKDVNDFYLNLALDTMQYRRQNGVARNDLLQLLMDLQNSHVDPRFAVPDKGQQILENEEFDELDVAANSFLFFIAGFETTASTLSFCVYELAINQDIQEKLRLEVQRAKAESGTFTYEILRGMNYMDAVITETLRKYPPTVLLSRQCTEEYVIPGTKVQLPVGTDVVIPIWSIQHDSKNYPNPETFDPERFVGDNKHSHPAGTFITFGDGPRQCLGNNSMIRLIYDICNKIIEDYKETMKVEGEIKFLTLTSDLVEVRNTTFKNSYGKRFAEMEIKAALAEIILKYDIKPCAKTRIPLEFRRGVGMLQSTCGTWVNLAKRK